jgi:hypothetical protein
MFITLTFYASGVIVGILIVAKYLEIWQKKSFFVLRIISRGDERLRILSHFLAHIYSELKIGAIFIIGKQIPLRSRGALNKTSTFIREHLAIYANMIRDSRLLKKSGGISEFFKNISAVEKGKGKIDDSVADNSPNSID